MAVPLLPADDAEQRPRFPSGRISKSLVYPLLIAVAFLVFEITHDTGLGIAVACAKLGFGDIGTAFWLRRTDPDLLRRRTCFWFFLAGGLLRMLIGMFVVSVVLVLLHVLIRQAPGAMPAVFDVMFRGTSILIVLLALAGWTAIMYALHDGMRVWIDPTISEARRNQGGPPSIFTSNRAVWIAEVAFWMPVLIVFFGLPTPFDLASVAVAIVAYPLFTALVLRRICAGMPFECWPMNEPRWSGHASS